MKRILSTRYSDNAFSFAIFLLRLAGGGMLIPHGYQKLQNFGKFSAGFADPFHIGSTASLSLVIFAEFFCAIFVVLGLFTRLAAIPPIIAMGVAVFIAHKGLIFTEGQTAALFLSIFLAILFVGAGKFSMDRIIGK